MVKPSERVPRFMKDFIKFCVLHHGAICTMHLMTKEGGNEITYPSQYTSSVPLIQLIELARKLSKYDSAVPHFNAFIKRNSEN